MLITRKHDRRHLPDRRLPVDQIIRAGALEAVSGFPDRSIGAMITDPPFFTSVGRTAGKAGFGEDPWEGVDSLQAAAAWSAPLMEQAHRIVRPGGAIAIMCGVHASAGWMLAAEMVGLKWMAELMVLWNTGKVRRNNFGSLHTHLLWFTRPGAKHTWNSNRKSFYSNILVAKKIPVGQRDHISQKPIELTNFMVTLLTRDNDVVLDPFCGSGSTLVSAALAGRHYIGVDKDKGHVATARNRIMHRDVEHEAALNFWLNGRLIEI